MPKVRATSARPPKPTKTTPTLPGLEAEPKRNQQHPDGGWLPAWITEQLRANKAHAAARVAKYRRCRKCKEIVLTGLSHDTCAWTVTADPTPLNRKTELAAILTNRQTFQAPKENTTVEPGYRLDYRHPGSTWTDRTPVLPEHRCGARFPGFLEPPAQPNGETNDYPDTPPF